MAFLCSIYNLRTNFCNPLSSKMYKDEQRTWIITQKFWVRYLDIIPDFLTIFRPQRVNIIGNLSFWEFPLSFEEIVGFF